MKQKKQARTVIPKSTRNKHCIGKHVNVRFGNLARLASEQWLKVDPLLKEEMKVNKVG
jgi:hypothetical protein